jgi:hypothetical protein
MYEIRRHVRDNLGIVTYSRTIKDGLCEAYVEAGSRYDYNSNTSRVYFSIKNNNPRAIEMNVVPIGVNGSEGFEITMNFRSTTTLIMLALKFIRRAIADCVKGKIF